MKLPRHLRHFLTVRFCEKLQCLIGIVLLSNDCLTNFYRSGMNHRMDHEKVEAELMEMESTEGIYVGLSFDGMVVKVRLDE